MTHSTLGRRSLLLGAAGLALAGLSTPASAAPRKLWPWPDAGLTGRFTASGVSDVFIPVAGQAFTLTARIASGAAGTMTVTRSTDAGLTWSPMMVGARAISTRSSSGKLSIFEASAGSLYRVECALVSGAIDYEVKQGNAQLESRQLADGTGRLVWVSDINTIGAPLIEYFQRQLNPTAAQMAKNYEAKFTPLSDADLAGDLTLYKTCVGNTIAKITVPAAAQRRKGPGFLNGLSREIRADYVDVVSVVDVNGVAVASAKSWIDASTVYSPGARVTSRDIIGNNTGVFMADTNWTGIYGYPTLIEAANGHLSLGTIGAPAPQPDLVALGL